MLLLLTCLKHGHSGEGLGVRKGAPIGRYVFGAFVGAHADSHQEALSLAGN